MTSIFLNLFGSNHSDSRKARNLLASGSSYKVPLISRAVIPGHRCPKTLAPLRGSAKRKGFTVHSNFYIIALLYIILILSTL